MSGSTHSHRIMALLATSPPLDDDEIAQALSITPRQTVNQICRRLAGEGVLKRERGPRGKVVNRIAGFQGSPAPSAIAPSTRTIARPAIENLEYTPRDLARTLIVIPCSKTKQNVDHVGEQGSGIADSLPPSLARELVEARARVWGAAAVDEATLIPAALRYRGSLYQHGRAAISDLMQAGAHVAIVSGGYGLVLASEPIGTYEALFKPSWWPQQLIGRMIAAYVQRHGLRSVRCAPPSSNYRKALASIDWRAAGIVDALLLMPQGGSTRTSPTSIGDALSALRDGELSADWKSSYGLDLGAA